MTTNSQLTYKKIVRFWFPLSATWLMMSAEMPFLTAVIARITNPEFNLAAFGVAYTIALIVESPVMMMLSASTALVENKNTFLKLRNFVYVVNAFITIFIIIFLLPPVFNFFAFDLLNLPPGVAHLTHIAVALLIPWAPSIGYRRFYQGILIRQNLTRYVAYGTVIRLLSMGTTALILFLFSHTHGVVIGAASLSVGVMMEAVAARIMSYKAARKYLDGIETSNKKISYKEIFHFYFPLALTTFISLGFQPVVTFFISHSRYALESLAVLPVINSLVFIFRGFGLSIPEAVIALMKNDDEYEKLKRFSFVLGISLIFCLSMVAFTPLADIWLFNISGLSSRLARFSLLPLMLYTFFPALTVWINFERAILIYSRQTKPLTNGIIVEVLGMFLVLFVTVTLLNFIGVVAAVIALTLGRFASNIYLMQPFNKCVRKIKFRQSEIIL